MPDSVPPARGPVLRAAVPQTDPGAAYAAQRHAIDAAIAGVLRSGVYVLGENVAAFEAEFACWLGARATVGVASGTDAVHLALTACGIGPGMAVATVSHTAIATIAAIELTGAVPLLLDIEPDGYGLDPAELAEVLANPPAGIPPVRAVLPVHLYGQAADMHAILPVCAARGVPVIEDASQAHGATVGGRRVGTLGQAAAFSFYPTKNLAAMGDGGAVATQDPMVAARLLRLRQYGWNHDRVCQEPGLNSRLDELQAAILRVRLPLLDGGNARRNAIAATYDAALSGAGIRPPQRRAGCSHVFHLYVVRTPDRAHLRARLRGRGIVTGIHYNPPAHLHPAYAGRVALGPGLCRRTEAAAAEVLSLPIFPDMTDDQVDSVADALRLP